MSVSTPEDNYVVLISGTPGVGKSSLSAALSAVFGCKVVEPSTIAVELNLGVPDPDRPGTLIIDEEALVNEVKRLLANSCGIIATHYPSVFLDDDELLRRVPFVVLLRTNPLELEKRLASKGWDRRKVLENVMAEALSAVAQELQDYSDMVLEVDTTGRDVEETVEIVLEKLIAWDVGINIDWLSEERVVEQLTVWGQELDLYEDG